jgi:hypothetical protein
VGELANVVKRKLDDVVLKHSGVIIDTPSQFMEQSGFEALTDTIDAFDGNYFLIKLLLYW